VQQLEHRLALGHRQRPRRHRPQPPRPRLGRSPAAV